MTAGESNGTVVVVGGARGFIGRGITRSLARHAFHVRTLDRSPRPPGDDLSSDSDSVAVQLAALLNHVEPSCIIHAIGSASVAASMNNPDRDFRANVEAFRELLEVVRSSGSTARVMLMSSAAVYGDPVILPVSESHEPAPISTYGHHKMLAELVGKCYAEIYGLGVTALRVFSVVGGEQTRLLPYELWERARNAPTISLQGSGRESRDYLHIDDLADAVSLLCRRETAPPFEVLNLASGTEVTTAEIAAAIGAQVAPGKQVTMLGQPRSGDPARWCADVSRLKQALPAWSPRPPVQAILDCCDDWSSR